MDFEKKIKKINVKTRYDEKAYLLWLQSLQIKTIEEDPLLAAIKKHKKLRTVIEHVFLRNPASESDVKRGKSIKKKYRKDDVTLLQKSNFFDAEWYADTYFDYHYSGLSPEAHYLVYGVDGRSPSVKFDGHFYLKLYPDVEGLNPLIHYLRNGQFESRVIQALQADLEDVNFDSSLAALCQDKDAFELWQEKKEFYSKDRVPNIFRGASIANNIAVKSRQPFFSIILPTYNTKKEFLVQCIDSVLAQTWDDWELCISDDNSSTPETKDVINEYVAKDARIKCIFREENGHISENSNTALSLATGKFVVLLDHDDELDVHALNEAYLYIDKYPEAVFFYSDEDKIDEEGVRTQPFFEPDFSPDLFYYQNYICHLAIINKAYLDKIGHFRKGYEGSQDYDLFLRLVGGLGDYSKIVHIPSILYHWRMSDTSTAKSIESKLYCLTAQTKAITDHLRVQNKNARVIANEDGSFNRIEWLLPKEEPLVSIVIATRNGYDYLKTCINSIIYNSDYENYEIIIVNNLSDDATTLEYLEYVANNAKVRVYDYPYDFNYSAIHNFAVAKCQGEFLAFVNNDVEIVNNNWLKEMVSLANRPEVGCVGAKLLYPDNTIQHGGIILGILGVAGHSHQFVADEFPGYFNRMNVVHNVSAVTAAVMVMRKEVYLEVGGMEEKYLPVAFNDVDLCLKVRQKGYLNVFTPFAKMYHFESKSRGKEDNEFKKNRFKQEVNYMNFKWGDVLKSDPYYNPNFSKLDGTYLIDIHV